MSITKKELLTLAIVFCALTLSLPGIADTFTLSGGISFDGKLLRTDDKFYYIDIGGRQKKLPKKSIKQVTKNDKDGAFDLEAAKERVAKRQQQLTEETGLTKEQRDEIERLISALGDEDKITVGTVREKLIELCKQNDRAYPFIATMAVSLPPHILIEVLSMLTQAEPERVKPLLQELVRHRSEDIRAICLELLGVLQDVNSLSLMMRGMLDHENVVVFGACSALAALYAKEATPLLLDKFNHTDLRVENVVRKALDIIWKAELGDKEPFKTEEEWRQFWNEQSPTVEKTIQVEILGPLVPPNTEAYHPCSPNAVLPSETETEAKPETE